MTALYRKVTHGKRTSYEAVAESVGWDSMPAGCHLLIVKPGQRSARYNVEPALADVLAVVEMHREALCRVVEAASALTLGTQNLTALEIRAFAAYKAIAGKDSLTLQRKSASDIVDALSAAIVAALGAQA